MIICVVYSARVVACMFVVRRIRLWLAIQASSTGDQAGELVLFLERLKLVVTWGKALAGDSG